MAVKKIAIMSSSWPPFGGGGISSAHYNLSRLLAEKGYENRVFTFLDHKRDKQVNIYRHGLPKIVYSFLDQFYWSVLTKILFPGQIAYQTYAIFKTGLGAIQINHQLRKYDPDVIIVPDHGAPLLFLRKPPKSRVIWISHHNPMRFVDIPLIGKYSKPDAKIANRLEQFALKKVDLAICPSNYMKDIFQSTYHFRKPIHVIPNFINKYLLSKDIPIADVRDFLMLPKNAFVLYIPSGGSKLKGSRFTAEIIRRAHDIFKHKNIGFYISGSIDSNLRFELNHLIEEHEVKIFLPGTTDYFTNISYIKSCSICVSPTLIECYGMALLESIYLGIPVIAFDTGGTKDIVKNGKNGYLVPFLDIESLIDQIRNMKDSTNYLQLKKSTLNCVPSIIKQQERDFERLIELFLLSE